MTRFGARSSTSTLKKVQLTPPGNHSKMEYQAAGWLPHSDNAAQNQFQSYVELLKSQGVAVSLTPQAPRDNPDAIYAYDNVLVLPQGAVIFRSCKRNRCEEWKHCTKDMMTMGIPIIAQIKAPAAIDGGDVFWLDRHTLAVGLSWRTNEAAIHQLRLVLEPMGIQVECFDLPNVNGESECLHLMSLISPINSSLALIEPRFIPVRLLKALDERNIHTIHAVPEEFDTLSTNVLALDSQRVIALSQNTQTNQLLRQAGLTVIPFEAPDLCVAGTGGPTCLTRIIYREDKADFES